ncbi:MAG: DciA family protein [Neisseria sp.]|uniref:DciA family protein n=1 Tax=Neisseria sp. TaxID=192066 RepID=UPI0026DDAE95|nr:DciA family protein [Neisseria sp.]MDO4641494.1 DciA family protein [Neisseria sp.]
MDLERISRRDSQLGGLLLQAKQWRLLDGEIKKILPANLRLHCQVACVDAEGCLIILAANNMAQSRLKMIAPGLLAQFHAINSQISSVRVKPAPKPAAAAKTNTLRLSNAALEALEDSARRVEHHFDLSQALRHLVDKYR